MFNCKKVEYYKSMVDQKVNEKIAIFSRVSQLEALISRAVFILVPFSENRTHTDTETLLRYIEKLEKAAKDESVRKDREFKERRDRQKIEQIVLDLKNRKWEPAE